MTTKHFLLLLAIALPVCLAMNWLDAAHPQAFGPVGLVLICAGLLCVCLGDVKEAWHE